MPFCDSLEWAGSDFTRRQRMRRWKSTRTHMIKGNLESIWGHICNRPFQITGTNTDWKHLVQELNRGNHWKCLSQQEEQFPSRHWLTLQSLAVVVYQFPSRPKFELTLSLFCKKFHCLLRQDWPSRKDPAPSCTDSTGPICSFIQGSVNSKKFRR